MIPPVERYRGTRLERLKKVADVGMIYVIDLKTNGRWSTGIYRLQSTINPFPLTGDICVAPMQIRHL